MSDFFVSTSFDVFVPFSIPFVYIN